MTSNSQQFLGSSAVEGDQHFQPPTTAARTRPAGEVVGVRRSGPEIACVCPWSRPLCVLVVDDDPAVADSFSLLLTMWGHTVRLAYAAAEALKIAAMFPPDVVLLDLAMPVIGGCEIARQLRHQMGSISSTLIAMTGYSDEVHRQGAAAAGFDHYFVKPVDLPILEKLLSSERVRLTGTRPAEA